MSSEHQIIQMVYAAKENTQKADESDQKLYPIHPVRGV